MEWRIGFFVGGLRQLAAFAGLVFAVMAWGSNGFAQELIPAAYTPAPYGINLISLALTHNNGDISFDPAAPIEDVSAQIGFVTLNYARTFSLAGRSANAAVILPQIAGDLKGLYLGEPASAHRSGLGDLALRFSVNLLGAPAMSPREYAGFKPGTMVGASLTVKAPIGQYDPDKLINLGTNRWAFKPEVGFVQAVKKWAFDAYLGGWFFTDNNDFLGGKTREQAPIFSTEFHVRYLFRPNLWASLDANFWSGGQSTVDGFVNDDRQENSRVGATVSNRIGAHHSLRFAASRGAITRIGGDFDSVGVSYAYSWWGKP
jgi:hypothetical protein